MKTIDSLEELSIQDFLEDIFTNTKIKKKRKEVIDYYIQKLRAGLFDGTEDGNITFSDTDIANRIDAILKADKADTDPYLSYTSPYYKRKSNTSPGMKPPIGNPDSNYMGKAGECAVMGELLFRGYNVNNMMVDEGVDLVASKDNVFFYIQVKTKSISEKNRFYFQIKRERFDAFIGTQMRYILVARCASKEGYDRNIFFKFNNDDIERLRFNNVIPKPSEGSAVLSLKIEFDERTGKAFAYDGKYREDVTYSMNNFKL